MPFYNAIKVVTAIGLVFLAIVTTAIVLIVKAKHRKRAAAAPAVKPAEDTQPSAEKTE